MHLDPQHAVVRQRVQDAVDAHALDGTRRMAFAPHIVDAAAQRACAVDEVREAGAGCGIRMEMTIDVDEAILLQAADGRWCCRFSCIRMGPPIPGCERLIEISQHDGLLHAMAPAQQLIVEHASFCVWCRARSRVIETCGHVC